MPKFHIQKGDVKSRARAGTIVTAHGIIETPAFIPVATKATVKSLTPEMVGQAVQAQAVLANTYHLYLQPGTEIIQKAGGLGKFMNWSGPTFTDSGGFQAFSLGAAFGRRMGKVWGAEERSRNNELWIGTNTNVIPPNSLFIIPNSDSLASIDDDGVTFRSVLDGSTHRFTPEISIDIQHAIGADIIFTFDECSAPDADYQYQKRAMDRTHDWAERCTRQHEAGIMNKELGGNKNTSSLSPQALFGIVQGGRHKDLRQESARIIGSMDFDGFGIGGSFDKDDIATAVGWVTAILPEEKPRHLLGIGEPMDLVLGIEQGIDTFDCVAPTRLGRFGTAYTASGRINLLNLRFVADMSPLDHDCHCYSCSNFTRAYIAHLFRAKEMLAATLASIHNLHFLIDITNRAREAILNGSFQEFKEKLLK